MHRLAHSLTNQSCGPLLIWNGPLQIWNDTLFSKMAPWCGQVRGHSLSDKKNFPIPVKIELFYFHPILMQFLAKYSSLWVIDGPYKFVCYYISKRGLKWPRFRNFSYLKGIYNFYFSSNFEMFFLLFNGLCWELSVVYRWISSIFYGFWDKFDKKRLKSVNFQIWKFGHHYHSQNIV